MQFNTLLYATKTFSVQAQQCKDFCMSIISLLYWCFCFSKVSLCYKLMWFRNQPVHYTFSISNAVVEKSKERKKKSLLTYTLVWEKRNATIHICIYARFLVYIHDFFIIIRLFNTTSKETHKATITSCKPLTEVKHTAYKQKQALEKMRKSLWCDWTLW